MLLGELTKESVEYGFTMTQEKATRKLKSGKMMEGLKAILKYKEEEQYVEVLAYGKKDTGIVIATLIHKQFLETDEAIHSDFWNTLEVKF